MCHIFSNSLIIINSPFKLEIHLWDELMGCLGFKSQPLHELCNVPTNWTKFMRKKIINAINILKRMLLKK